MRLARTAVEALMDGRADGSLEGALEVFEVFASGSLTDEVYILEDVGGQAHRDRARRRSRTSIGGGEPWRSSRSRIRWAPAVRRSAWRSAQRLGYRYVDQELLQDAARRYGLAEDKLSHLDESKPTLFERFDTETRHHITVLQTTLLEFAELDNAVLMGGGGQWLLRGVPHVLRVRVIAPFEHRVKQWIKRTADDDGRDPQPARGRRAGAPRRHREGRPDALPLRGRHRRPDALRADGQHREAALRRRGGDDRAASIRAARRWPPPTPAARSSPRARSPRASRWRWRRIPETRRYRITVEAQGGVVTLEGTAALDRAVEVARTSPACATSARSRSRFRRSRPSSRRDRARRARGYARSRRAGGRRGGRSVGGAESGASAIFRRERLAGRACG